MNDIGFILTGKSGAAYRCGACLGKGSTAYIYEVSTVGGVEEARILKYAIAKGASKRIEKFFRAEIRALRDLRGLLSGYNLIDDGVDRDDLPFLITDLVLGSTLRECYTHASRFPLPGFWDIAISAIQVLMRIHGRGWIHRDLKIDNVIVGSDGRAVILDFGLAINREDARRQQEPNLGSGGYMAPEQVYGGPVSPAADIYAAGCLLLRLFTGKKSFSSHELVFQPRLAFLHEQLLPLVWHPNLCRLIGDMLNSAPERRPSALEVYERLLAARNILSRLDEAWPLDVLEPRGCDE